MSQPIDALVSRIRKLLALAQDAGATEHEAAAAAAKVQELLQAHNLDMAQVDAGRQQAFSSLGTPDEPREKTQHAKAAMYKYQRELMAALARNNFCMHWIDEVWRADPRGQQRYVDGELKAARLVKAHYLLGRQVNVVTTQVTYDYLVDTMDRLLPYVGMQKRGKEALLWLAGCTERLIERLNELREQAERASLEAKRQEETRARHPAAAPGTALVTLADVYGSEDDLNTDAMWGNPPGTTARERRDNEAHWAARKAENAARIAALVAQGIDKGAAWYMVVYGIGQEDAERRAGIRPEEPAAPETEAQAEKRRARERRERARNEERWYKERTRERARTSHPAYQAGRSKGSDIGLDQQVSHRPARGIK